MWGQYDENLTDNVFLKELLTNHVDIVKKSCEENWVICVPRTGTLDLNEITSELFLDHVIIPNYRHEFSFCTLSKRQLSIANREIKTSQNSVRILFDETFYIEGLKYTVWCLESPLFNSGTVRDIHHPPCLETLHDCVEFLWNENLGEVLAQIQMLCGKFAEENQEFPTENLQNQKDLIGNLYSQCLQVTLKTAGAGNKICSEQLENFKLAVETYMQNCLDKTLIEAINTLTWQGDAHFNKLVRNSSEVQLKDLSISGKFGEVIANAKSELNKINNFSTILDKIYCLKLTFSQLYNSNNRITSDDILQILVFLIIKLNVNNWLANLAYLTQFKFSALNFSDQTSFLVTSLEAALEFVKSNQFFDLKRQITHSSQPAIFETVRSGDLATLRASLRPKKTVEIELCHPLCDCDSCQSKQSNNSGHNLQVVNEKGQSLLIFATATNNCGVAEFLIGRGAQVNSVDYFGKTALHYACANGYQDILLILVNSKGSVNAKDDDGNTPLHLAVNNGHENCVKALIYTGKNLEVDSCNKRGDTPLHLAVKWGFVEIIKILLENRASVSVVNKRNETAASFARNYYSKQLLKQYFSKTSPVAAIPGEITPRPPAVVNLNKCREHGVKPRDPEQLKKVDLLLKAIENNDLPLTCFYLGFSRNPPPNSSFESKCHPLCNCEKCEDYVAPQTQLEQINVNTCNGDGVTALHYAAKFGRSEILRILLDSRALPNLKTYETLYTPLHFGCIYQRLEAVKELVKCGGCCLDVQDFNGNTPLHYACAKNDSRVAEVLLSNGADCNLTNYEGKTVVKEAHEKRLYNMLKLLKDWKVNVDSDNDLF